MNYSNTVNNRFWATLWGLIFASGSLTTNAFASIFNGPSGPPPVITSQPASQSLAAGVTATFSVTVTSASALTYQWYFKSIAISGATNSTYAIPNAQATNAGPYYVYIANTGGSINSSTATLTVTNSLPAPWISLDVGPVGLAGTGYANTNLYTVIGAGANLSGATADQFHYVYQTMPGNGSLVAKLNSQSGTNVNGLAGIMIRETTQAGASFMAAARAGNGLTLVRRRMSTGAATTTITNGPALALSNFWLELVRSNNVITALSSTNGTSWLPFSTNSFTMATNITFGLFVTSGATNVLSTASLTGLKVVP